MNGRKAWWGEPKKSGWGEPKKNMIGWAEKKQDGVNRRKPGWGESKSQRKTGWVIAGLLRAITLDLPISPVLELKLLKNSMVYLIIFVSLRDDAQYGLQGDWSYSCLHERVNWLVWAGSNSKLLIKLTSKHLWKETVDDMMNYKKIMFQYRLNSGVGVFEIFNSYI